MFTKLMTAGIMLSVLTLSVLKLPYWMARPFMRIPSWFQSLGLHFGYGSWLGGVTGHLVAGFMSIPWYFISELYLRPKILRISRPKVSDLFKHSTKPKKVEKIA